MTKEIRMSNDQIRMNEQRTRRDDGVVFELRASTFIRHSSFFGTKKPQARIACGFRILCRSALVPVVADGFDRATFLGFLALRFLFGRTRLVIDEGIAAVVVAFEIVRGGFAAE